MSKLQDIRNLVQEHAVLVSSSPGDWMDYMDTASRLYRYSFSDQLLIHAQRPDATACASLELWNEKILRWVNRGARGIALFDETWQNTKLRYVFDISDTHMVAGGRSPYLWKMQEHQREEILTHLAEVYALEEKDTATLQDALMAVAREMVNDNLEEYLDGLEYAVEGTYLEDLDEVTIRSDFRQLATDSVYYLLSRRCGLDPMELLEEEDFMHITDYNRLSVLTFLGNAASQLSESILIDIGKTVHKISLEEARKEVENSNERNYNNFTTLIHETKNRDAETKKEENIENEGGTDYGTDISSQGRLPVSESDRRRGRSDDREIRDAAEDISEGTQEQPLSEPVPDREAEQPSGTDRESSTGENGQPDGETAGEESGTGQGSRSDGMDSTHERTDGNSGREHLDGIGIQLVEDTREDGLSKAEEEIASALSLPEYPTANEQRRQIEERAAALYAEELKADGGVISGEQFVDECQVESDLELLLPADYVTGSSERMLLYRELDGLTLDKDVDAFRSRLEDRFGPIPPETEELLRIVPLRRLAARLGVEKVFLKGGRMSLFFVSNPDSPYYQSQAFGKVIAYMMKYTRRCDLREQNNKRSMLVKDVKTVEEAVCVLQEVVAMQVEE